MSLTEINNYCIGQSLFMYLKEIIHGLIDTYKKIDLRLVVAKSEKEYELAFLKILLSRDQNIKSRDVGFFNSLSSDLRFIQKALDVSQVDVVIDSLQKGTLEIDGHAYPISTQEVNYLQENLRTDTLYSEWTSNLYVRRQVGIDNFPLLLIRPTFDTTCSSILSSIGTPNKIKGYGTEETIHSFLDASSINSTNSRIVILLPIYCMLKQNLSDFELSCHIALLNKMSLRVLNGDPRSFLLSEIISDRSNEIIQHPIENNLIKDSSQIRLYSDSLDLELDKKEIFPKSSDKVILPCSTHNKNKDYTKNLEKIQIFISYAREDYRKALRLYNDLSKQERLNPWLDKKCVLPGQKWKVAISNAIRNSRFFVAFLSSNSVNKVGYGQKELKEGLEILDNYPESDVFIIPARLDNCKVSDSRLNEIQYVDFFPNWSKGLAKILETIDTHL